MTLRCLLVDDNQHFLAAAREILEREGLVVEGCAFGIIDAIGQATALRPDVALVDIKLGGESGFDLATMLTTPVILISTHDEDDYADLIAASPAIGFLAKTELSADAVRRMLSIFKEGQDR